MDSMDFLVQQNLDPNGDDIAENSPCGQYTRYNTLIGKGTFKEVYKGFDHIHNIEIAWNKICIQETSTHEKPTLDSINELEKLCYEAVLLKSMNHKNIMNCYTYWVDEENRTVNIITEFLCSGSLRQHLEKHGKVKNVETIKNWGRQILQGLHYLHTQYPCIIHRDLKCDNIFVNIEKGEVKIGDFGLSTVRQQGQVHEREVPGTREFMAPEIYLKGNNELVDVYSFGMCLIELATAKLPYAECKNIAQFIKKLKYGNKPSILKKVKDHEVKEIIEKCLLPALSRPSALELLNDPFFSDSLDIELDSPCSSSTTS
ncbi:hypothetical protein RD792_003191 [Penstemon davidsonii]|uniref:non-specific serine/threonine protein kinase n=1 Tax=Penstemon davidsonii TaxID=160366 RepID=A0ABR0DU66_9LAMI|nr:hypothetical protein RD792_003191 [Penstemon davidsonii]